jgi:hypothetical protein
MADQPPSKDAAMQQRIITHMNADHQPSLSLYLQHYLALSPRAARNPTLTSISLSSLSILTRDGKTHTIPFKPPMTSYAEARTRTVEMDREAREALGVSSIRITTFSPPKSPFHLTILFLVLLTFTIFLTRQKIVPGTLVYDRILPYFPGGPTWFLWIANTILLPVLAIHITETVVMERTRLRKYGVERGSGLWWVWMVDCFLEGYGSFQRFDGLVEGKRREAEKAKH